MGDHRNPPTQQRWSTGPAFSQQSVGCRGHHLPLPHRHPVAGSTPRRIRPLADRLETAPSLQRRRHLGAVLTYLLTIADAEGKIDWTVSVDASITRAHQHATNTTRPEQDTGGSIESQESSAGGD